MLQRHIARLSLSSLSYSIAPIKKAATPRASDALKNQLTRQNTRLRTKISATFIYVSDSITSNSRLIHITSSNSANTRQPATVSPDNERRLREVAGAGHSRTAGVRLSERHAGDAAALRVQVHRERVRLGPLVAAACNTRHASLHSVTEPSQSRHKSLSGTAPEIGALGKSEALGCIFWLQYSFSWLQYEVAEFWGICCLLPICRMFARNGLRLSANS